MNDAQPILLIEDNITQCEHLIEIFQHCGYEALIAHTGEEGLEIIKKCTPLAIICDIMLPGIDGFRVLEHIKTIINLTLTPFIFLTAKSETSVMRRAMNMGADDFITKPFDYEDLVNSISARIEKITKIKTYEETKKHQLTTDIGYDVIYKLSKTEIQILAEIAKGYTTQQIANNLKKSPKTIKNHRNNISRKLSLQGPNSLINFAFQVFYTIRS